MFERKIVSKHYEGAVKPFKIIGNVYFVGCIPASSHLIDTGDGLILIDTGYEDTLFMLVDSVYRLGFQLSDIKYIIHTHWHSDHTAATAGLVALTGAKTFIGHKDAENAKAYFLPDEVLHTGKRICLGNTEIDILETPGHTEGCISLFFNTEANGKAYRVGMFGGAGVNTLTPGHYEYPNCVADYLNSLKQLHQEKVDVFIGNHANQNNTAERCERLFAGDKLAFYDPEAWGGFLDGCRERLDKMNVDDPV
jgi:metallo-beta-lactamase class B